MDFDIALYLQRGIDYALAILPGILLAVATLVIGFWLANKADDLVESGLEKTGLSPELTSFFGSMTTILIKAFTVLTAAGMLGFETSALFGVIAAGAFAIGFALQGSLSNFAAGILILLFKPFRVGDWISASDVFGKVESIQILNTIVISPGSKTLIIPNADIIGGVVTNFTTKGVIRLELTIPVGYASSFPQIESILRDVLAKAPYVLQDPAPEIGIEAYDSHNIIVAVRPYVLPDDYWAATFEVNRRIKSALSEAQIPMAYSEGVELGEIGA